MVGTLVRGCRCATSWCDLDLTFYLAIVTLTYKILSGLYLGNCLLFLPFTQFSPNSKGYVCTPWSICPANLNLIDVVVLVL